MYLLESLSLKTQKFTTLSLYSRFSLGKDLLLNISIEQEGDTIIANCRLRSQNKGVVVLIGNLLKKFNN